MPIPDAVREWFSQIAGTPADNAADPEETPEPVGEGEDPTTETDPTKNDAADGEAPVDENTDTTGGDRTAPEPETPLTDTERDAMNTLAGENEALRQENADLRTRIAELGGDAALGVQEEEVIETPDPEEDEYDPDADIADQESELRRLRGE